MTDVNAKIADPDYISEYVASIGKSEWLECRENRHDLRPYKVSLVDPQDETVVDRVKKCRRCGTRRIETLHVMNGRAHRIALKYEGHPEGYLLAKGHGRLDGEGRDIIRFQTLHNELLRQAKKSR